MSFNLIYANIYLSVYVVVVCAHMTIINLRCKKKRLVKKGEKRKRWKATVIAGVKKKVVWKAFQVLFKTAMWILFKATLNFFNFCSWCFCTVFVLPSFNFWTSFFSSGRICSSLSWSVFRYWWTIEFSLLLLLLLLSVFVIVLCVSALNWQFLFKTM